MCIHTSRTSRDNKGRNDLLIQYIDIMSHCIYWQWWHLSFSFLFAFFLSFFFSKLSSDSHLLQLRCQVTWTSMKNFISPFSFSFSPVCVNPFHIYFSLSFPKLWVLSKNSCYQWPINLLNVSWPKTTQEHICTPYVLSFVKQHMEMTGDFYVPFFFSYPFPSFSNIVSK